MSFTSAFKGKNDYEVHFIGIGNITRWNDLKQKLQCANNIIFISKLLDIALEHYYIHYNSKESNDIIYKLDPTDNNDIDNITLDPAPPTDDNIVEAKPQLKKTETHDDTSIKSCTYCDLNHSLLHCPLVEATKHCHVPDCIQLDEWVPSASALCYSYASAPRCLKVRDCDTDYNDEEELGTTGVFCVASNGLGEQFALGPLVGRELAAATIAIDCDMRHMHTMYRHDKRRANAEEEHEQDETKSAENAIETIHISSECDTDSNWVRHVRPASERSDRNVTTVQSGECLYLVTIRRIQYGEELRYWDDSHDVIASLSSSNGTKKKADRKTACGGCGLRFVHTLYYRQHCLVHHDTGRSLATRKYHCLVCGLAVVGKERMRRHAQQAHQGRGAYQCQYCGKYFLRRNYLDVHRRYGCGRNPQRAKPLCDLCGKEFCQPQKLKVHIKRMHSSEMEDVLREFQCKRCMKLLGSRAALQRHVKEVHEGKEQQTTQVTDQAENNGEAVVALISTNSPMCSKCGKQFQNKSNLKIHMLTHSGVKPFQCAEGKGCTAAFTTKQCLQFHYRRVHGYQDGDNMPRIERTVDYTLEAYSGGTTIPSPPPTSPTKPTTRYSPQTTGTLGTTGNVVSKGSKKWMIEQPVVDIDNNSDNSSSCGSAISLLVDEADVDDVIREGQMTAVEVDEDDASDAGSISCRSLNQQHQTTQPPVMAQSASTASLLVEAALDSVNCNTSTHPTPPLPPPLSLSTSNQTTQQLDIGQQQPLAVDCRTSALYGGGLRAASVSPLLGRYGGGGDSLALQLDLSIYKHYAATVVDTVVRKYGATGEATRPFQQPSDQSDLTPTTDRYMRFLDNPPLSLASRLDTCTQQYSPNNQTIDCHQQQLNLDIEDTTKAKLDLSMSYYDTALEEIRSRLAAYEAAAAATNDSMGKMYGGGVEQHDNGGGGFLLDGVGEFRSFEPFVLQGGGSSPQGGSNADLQGLDMSSTGCRTTAMTTTQQQYQATNNPPSPCSSPGGLTSSASTYAHHHRFPHLHLNLDHHLQPPPRLNSYSPTLIVDSSSAAVVVADLSLRHHAAAAAAVAHHSHHAHAHHEGFGAAGYSHSPPPSAAALGYPPPPPGASAGVYHPHYPQYY